LKSKLRLPIIGIIGAGACTPEIEKIAYETGAAIAGRKAVLLCGGLGGVMGAAAQGASEAGGLTIGLLPGTDRNDASRFIQIPLATGLDHARNAVLARSSDALIAISGGYGTLSEIAFALKMGKPIVGIRSWTSLPDLKNVQDADQAVGLIFQILESASYG
jgi:uncharacterized protein (TIGR00725 family)